MGKSSSKRAALTTQEKENRAAAKKNADAIKATTQAASSVEVPPATGDNQPAEIDHDAFVAKGRTVSQLWNKADKAQGSADAHAAILLVQAHRFGFFTEVNPATWHKIGTAKVRTAFANTVLTELFAIEAPTAAERQRLQRIKIVVPAIIKAGGVDCVELSKGGQIMLDTNTQYFKSCMAAVEATGKFGLSIAKLAKGANKYLDKEIVRSTRAASTTTGDAATTTTKAKLAELAQAVEGKVASLPDGAASLDEATNKALQALLVQLLGVFAADKDTGLDVDKVAEIYKVA